jgi:broad specificity phosphatase PhoE
MNNFWRSTSGIIPRAGLYHVSPMARCLETCRSAFTGLPGFKPIIKEMVRERLGVHTCDRRHPRAWIAENFQEFAFEEGFVEGDELWRADVRETLEEHAVRVRKWLDDLFSGGEGEIVSLTAHSGTILALYEVIGHPAVRVAPGAVVPLLIRGEKAGGTSESG